MAIFLRLSSIILGRDIKIKGDEIVALKKENVFTGYVVHTIAHIQALWKRLNSELLISEAELQNLNLPSIDRVPANGSIPVAGKEDLILLHGITRSDQTKKMPTDKRWHFSAY